ncbi:MAG: MraY family glycosyltransferase, partial [bacterium]|nr:MraY family glycosyltransferase [bacterium]
GALVVVAIGFLDDRRDTNPYMRLVAQFIAAGIVAAAGIGIAFATNPMTGGILDFSIFKFTFTTYGEVHSVWILSSLLAIVWIVSLMNSVSWSSGVDGQLSGFTAIAALFITLSSLEYSADITQWPATILAAATFGAFLGFLPWHVFPQKIMPGFGGATLAGFMLAVLSILTATKVGTLLLILGIPIADSAIVAVRRLLQGKSPVWGDRKHLHHRLLDAGWSKQKIAIFYWGTTALLGVLALNLNAQGKLYTMVGIVLLVGGLMFWTKLNAKKVIKLIS